MRHLVAETGENSRRHLAQETGQIRGSHECRWVRLQSIPRQQRAKASASGSPDGCPDALHLSSHQLAHIGMVLRQQRCSEMHKQESDFTVQHLTLLTCTVTSAAGVPCSRSVTGAATCRAAILSLLHTCSYAASYKIQYTLHIDR